MATTTGATITTTTAMVSTARLACLLSIQQICRLDDMRNMTYTVAHVRSLPGLSRTLNTIGVVPDPFLLIAPA